MHKTLHHQINADGIEALAIRSDRTFPRHSHDDFGFGYVVAGGQESWSGRGLVEAGAGLAILPEICTIKLRRGDLAVVPLSEPWSSRQLHLCARDFSALTSQAALLAQQLMQEGNGVA